MILRFHDELTELFPKEIKMEATTPLDALKLLATQHPLCGKMKPVPVKIRQLDSMSQMYDPTITEDDRVFDIVPADFVPNVPSYNGAGGDNGWVNIIIGIVLIVVAIVAPPVGIAAMGATAGSFAATAIGYLGTVAMSIGVGLAITGLMQLLAPTPSTNEKDGNYSSRTFGARTTTEVGTPIQMVFGKHKVGFHLFSFNADARKYSGIDDPETSPYFTQKVNENMPSGNLNRFYGYIQAGNKTIIRQTDNSVYRTGSEY